ncbi:hypothetical protein HanRHA438_Chr09g0405111 [Helianthus annuus]|nr:hypothetical protein HanRHA438_Chr09g0405111 [Helianthus annuus]
MILSKRKFKESIFISRTGPFGGHRILINKRFFRILLNFSSSSVTVRKNGRLWSG